MRQPWLRSAPFDSLCILAPPLAAAAAVLAMPELFRGRAEVPPWAWIALVLCVDVAHVYGTLWRTYFDPSEKDSPLLWAAPIGCWMAGTLLYTIGPMFFWTALAYLAVFHFVRQQYGFLRIYSRGEPGRASRMLDSATLHLSMLYPLVFWHSRLPRNFHWFVDGDFVPVPAPWLERGMLGLYLACLSAYVLKELAGLLIRREFNFPRNALVLGTAAAWYAGIVRTNDDLAFTATNVVAHGIPYLALVWVYGNNRGGRFFAPALVPAFVAALIALAFLEEGLWDGLVWRDHPNIFGWFSLLPRVNDRATLAWLIPLLALPQSTHYIMDGFVWRLRRGNLRRTLFVGERTA